MKPDPTHPNQYKFIGCGCSFVVSLDVEVTLVRQFDPTSSQSDPKSPTWNENDLTRLGKKATDFQLHVDFWQVENSKKQEEEL